MNREMTIEDVVDVLKRDMELTAFDPNTGEVKEVEFMNDLNRDSYYAYENAIKYLEQMEQGWIPVSERLPEKGVAVLVCYDCGAIDIDTRVTARPRFYEQGWRWYDAGENNVIAWMPLPEHYEPNNQEEIR